MYKIIGRYEYTEKVRDLVTNIKTLDEARGRACDLEEGYEIAMAKVVYSDGSEVEELDHRNW
jgi:hypothetical protein